MLRTNVTSINRLSLYLKSINAVGNPEQSPAKCCFLHNPPLRLPFPPQSWLDFTSAMFTSVFISLYSTLHLLSSGNVKWLLSHIISLTRLDIRSPPEWATRSVAKVACTQVAVCPQIHTYRHTLENINSVFNWPLFLSRCWQFQSCMASKPISINNMLRQREQKLANGCRHGEKHSELD